jgi:hypothetical protein
MTHARASLASAAVFALLFGLEYPNPNLSGEPAPLPYDRTMTLAANEAPNDQAQVQTEDKLGAQKDDGLEDDSQNNGQPAGAHPGNEN